MKENNHVFLITFSKICASVVLAVVNAGLIFLTKFVVQFSLVQFIMLASIAV
jgi:hypothetical protein